ncbi:family 15 member [Seminavis robusta]|uniref:Family 15 member n=1 Tax=Seminavis robusta TaxID=568900 RepID=A0A9N8EK57_9STRA|nr:family 15 member [Seminavis robusta]|eukprot:Sro1319_g262280.1 family 15 member (850) ;mRNA; f:16210-18853
MSPRGNLTHHDSHHDEEMSNESMHSVTSTNSVISSSTTTSLQDVELADGSTNPQEALNAGKKKRTLKRVNLIESKIIESLKVARDLLFSSSLQGMNPVVLCILITEAAERFAFYGFRASLVLYFTQELKMDDTTAISLFAFASYVANFTPIFGAVLGDGKLGRFQTIVAFGFVYWLGLIVLTHAAFLSNHTVAQLRVKRIVTVCGLALICTGTGGIKPCVSIFGADQVQTKKDPDKKTDAINDVSRPSDATLTSTTSTTMDPEEQEKVRTFFSFFSMCINLGAVASFVIIPTIKGSLGFGAAFLVPTVFMCFAILVFTSQRHNYVIRPHNPHGSSLYTTFRLCLWLLHNNLWANKFISRNFPSLEPGPVPLPSVLPQRADMPGMEGLSVAMGNDEDHASVSSVSMSTMRSLSRSIGRSLSRTRNRSRSRSRSSPESRRTLNTEDMPSDHPLRNANRNNRNNNVGNGLEVPSRSPSQTSSSRMKSSSRRRSRSRKHATDPSPRSRSISAASLQTSDRYLAQQLSDAARALNVLPVFAMLPCFWMLYDQQGSVWTLQASRMNLYGVIQPEQINVLNPIGLFVLIPVFDRVVYPALQKREIDISPLRRMGWGMVLVSSAFYISGIVEYVIDYRIQNGLSPISVAWQIPQICLMTVAEIFISVTGLEFAYSVSPDRLKSFVMAAYLSTIAKGDFWGGVLYSTVFRDMNQAVVLHIFSVLMMFNLIFYGVVVRNWELRHGLVSWDLFDKVLETESRQRPCWRSHHRQYLNAMEGAVVTQPEDPPSGKKERSRGRARYRRRDVKRDKGAKKKRDPASKKEGSKRRRNKKSSSSTFSSKHSKHQLKHLDATPPAMD